MTVRKAPQTATVAVSNVLPCRLPTFLGYKAVNVYNNKTSRTIGSAILWLHMDPHQNKLCLSASGEELSWAQVVRQGLSPGTKYAIQSCQVIGVQFVASHLNQVLEMCLAYQRGEVDLRSKWDPDFQYEVEQKKEETYCGKLGQSGCCHGIHFFINPQAAHQYAGDKIVVTRRFQYAPPESRKLALALPDPNSALIDDSKIDRTKVVEMKPPTSFASVMQLMKRDPVFERIGHIVQDASNRQPKIVIDVPADACVPESSDGIHHRHSFKVDLC